MAGLTFAHPITENALENRGNLPTYTRRIYIGKPGQFTPDSSEAHQRYYNNTAAPHSLATTRTQQSKHIHYAKTPNQTAFVLYHCIIHYFHIEAGPRLQYIRPIVKLAD